MFLYCFVFVLFQLFHFDTPQICIYYRFCISHTSINKFNCHRRFKNIHTRKTDKQGSKFYYMFIDNYFTSQMTDVHNLIHISSSNLRGIHDPQKRKDLFNYLRTKRNQIYSLQNTHFTESLGPYIRAEWGDDI